MLSGSRLSLTAIAVAACALTGTFAGPARATAVETTEAAKTPQATHGLIADDQRIIDALVMARVRTSDKRLAEARDALGRAQTILLNLKQVPSRENRFYKTAQNDVAAARQALARGDAATGTHRIAAAEGSIQNAVDARGTISEVAQRMH